MNVTSIDIGRQTNFTFNQNVIMDYQNKRFFLLTYHINQIYHFPGNIKTEAIKKDTKNLYTINQIYHFPGNIETEAIKKDTKNLYTKKINKIYSSNQPRNSERFTIFSTKKDDTTEVRDAKTAAIYAKYTANNEKDPIVQFILGYFYQTGLGVKTNPNKAAFFYKLAAKQGYNPAQFELALCYKDGYGVKSNQKKAVKYFELAALQDNIDAQFFLGEYYRERHYQKASPDKKKHYEKLALIQYNNAAKQKTVYIKSKPKGAPGHEIAQLYLGLYYKNFCKNCVNQDEKTNNLNKAFKWFIKSAKHGNQHAQYELGVHYKNNLNFLKARHFYELSAKASNHKAYFQLGYLYSKGLGVKINEQKAICYFRQVIQIANNSKLNLNNTKRTFMQGLLSTLNEQDVMNGWARNTSGNDLRYGIGTKKNLNRAFAYYQSSAEENYTPAFNNLAVCYKKGLGVEKNLDQMYFWYKKSSDQGDAEASFCLGQCYEKGIDVLKDLAISFDYYKLAAKKNHTEAQFRLGICYETGSGVLKDLSVALNYYKLAAEKNHTKAQYRLDIIMKQNLM